MCFFIIVKRKFNMNTDIRFFISFFNKQCQRSTNVGQNVGRNVGLCKAKQCRQIRRSKVLFTQQKKWCVSFNWFFVFFYFVRFSREAAMNGFCMQIIYKCKNFQARIENVQVKNVHLSMVFQSNS